MRFGAPAALLLLLFVPYLIWLGQPWRSGAKREWLALALRLLILLLISLSLAGTRLVRAADELAVVFLIDGSDSMASEQLERAEDYVRQAIEDIGADEQAAVVIFGANALVERPMSGLADLAPVTTLPLGIHTDIAEAVRLGLALFPAGSARRIVLLSDGAATLGDTLGAAEISAASGVPIDVVALTRLALEAEVYLRDVRAPTRVREGEAFNIDVAVESQTAGAAELQVLAGGALLHRQAVRLQPGANNFVIRLQATEQQFARYVVQLVAGDDGYYQNNRLAVFTQIDGPPSVLLVAGHAGPDDSGSGFQAAADDSYWQQLQLALNATGLIVEHVAPSQMPADLEGLSNYDSIILVDVNAKLLTPRKMAALRSYVRDLGGGLVAVGGPESYSMGGYFRTALEELLPVDMQITDQERFPAVSLALVIDRSGSMSAMEGGVRKIQLAAEGAARVVELLNDFDEITIIPVDTAPDAVIGPASTAEREQIISQIGQIGAGGGGIYVRTGLEAAAAALAPSPNQVKHIILLADGADSEQKEGVPELISALVAEGVTVSTVSIGGGPDVPWLQEMAELGGGRFHFTDRAANLPQIFTQETTAIQRSYLIEERFFPAVGQSTFARQHPVFKAMQSSGITRVPPLFGYVGTSPKQTAQVILDSHLGDPLLAVWEYGLGRSVSWTSDATGRWGAEWVSWPGFPTFWSNLVRWSIGDDSGSSLEAEVQFTGEMATLVVDARDGNDVLFNDLTLEAVIVDPNGEASAQRLSQVAPGRYEASFMPVEEGAYLLRVAGGAEDASEIVGQTSGWVLGYSPEYRQLEGDTHLLDAIAELTGGRNLTPFFADGDHEAILSHDLPSGAASRPIWPWLLMLAVLLLPLDIAVRRIVVSGADVRRLWHRTVGRVWRPSTPVAARSDQVARLFQAKARANQPQDKVFSGEQSDTAAGESPAPQDAAPVSPDTAITSEPARSPDNTAADAEAASEAAPGTLASRLLERRRRQEQDRPGDE